MAERPALAVVAAVLLRPDGRFLLASRPPGKSWAGYWEFPGGKIEPGETPGQALRREIEEELGLSAVASTPWFVTEHDYPHARVRLFLRRAWRWRGRPRPREGQELGWFRGPARFLPPELRLLPLDAAVVDRVALPTRLILPRDGALSDTAAALAAAPGSGLLARDPTQLAAARRAGLWAAPLPPDPFVCDRREALARAAAGAPFALALGRDGCDALNPLPVYLPAAAGDAARLRRRGAHGTYLSL